MWSFLETGTNKEVYLIWHYFIWCHNNKHTDFFHLISNSWYNSLCFPWENKRLQEVGLPVITQLSGERGAETKPLEASIPVMASHLPRVQFNQQILPDSPEVSITGNKLHYMIPWEEQGDKLHHLRGLYTLGKITLITNHSYGKLCHLPLRKPEKEREVENHWFNPHISSSVL